ncbi:MAG: F0F1 ATP synthase subunit B [Chloroflexi bacterium]|nr:F0F1 ATP synthase subunit B [Chloroflexota bacterium]
MDALGINLPGLIAQIINFTLLLGILYLVLYKPILRMLDQRSQRIQESLDTADRVQQESVQADEEVKKQINAAREEGRNIVGQATQVAERVREDARTQARTEAEAILQRAQAEIQRERDQAIEELRLQFAELTIAAAERVINASLDSNDHRRLIEEVLQESGNLGRN